MHKHKQTHIKCNILIFRISATLNGLYMYKCIVYFFIFGIFGPIGVLPQPIFFLSLRSVGSFFSLGNMIKF